MPNKYILLLFFLPKKYFDSPRMSILGEMCINTKKNTKNEWYLTGIKKTKKKDRLTFLTERRKKIRSKSHMPYHTFLLVFFWVKVVYWQPKDRTFYMKSAIMQKKTKISKSRQKFIKLWFKTFPNACYFLGMKCSLCPGLSICLRRLSNGKILLNHLVNFRGKVGFP